jgi:nucleolar pre-ribosomal-associated protein 2
MPGLYAVLDVMPRDLMRGMNAAMDSSSRAIFKALYEDYQRFGRWNQN